MKSIVTIEWLAESSTSTATSSRSSTATPTPRRVRFANPPCTKVDIGLVRDRGNDTEG